MLVWLLLSVCLAVYLAQDQRFRDLVDGFLGKPKPASAAPQVTVKKQDVSDNQTPTLKPDSQLVTRLECPAIVAEPLEKLLHLVVRDFVAGWYTSYISLGDERFLLQARSQLNILVNNLSHRIQALDTKEVAVYLVHSLSTSLVREMQDKQAGLAAPAYDEKAIIAKLRQTSQELLHLVAPASLLASAATVHLLTEILALQLWKIVESLNADWFNQQITSYLGAVQASNALLSVTPPSTSRSSSPTPILPDATPKLSSSTSSNRARTKKDVMAAIKADVALCTAGTTAEVNSFLLQTILRLDDEDDEPNGIHDPVGKQMLSEVLSRRDEELADAFQSFIESLPPIGHARAQLFTRLYGQLTSYAKVVDMTLPDALTLKQDSLAMLGRMIDALESESAQYLQTVLYRCLVAIVGPHPKKHALEDLLDWIFEELHADYFQAFLKGSGNPKTPTPAQTVFSPISQVLSPITQVFSPATSPPSVRSPSIRTLSPRSSMDSLSDGETPFEMPTVSVTITDMSSDEAYDGAHCVVAKRHLAFLIALEIQDGGSPGYILQRGWGEIEKMHSSLGKTARPSLPAVDGLTSDDACRNVEAYLSAILRQDDLSQSGSVQTFFEKERAGPSQPGLSLWDLGKGASRATKRTASLASKGFSNASKSINSVGNVLLKPTDSLVRKLSSASVVQSQSNTSLHALMDQSPATSPVRKSFDSTQDIPITTEPESFDEAPTTDIAERELVDSFKRLNDDASDPIAREKAVVAPEKPPTPIPKTDAESQQAQSQLTAHDFDLVLNCGLSVLEEAYLLSNSQWSLKRGILGIISTVVRTSYAAYIKVAFLQAINTADAETVGRKIGDLCESFWPNDKWYSTDATPAPIRNDEEIEESRVQARKLLIAQAPEGLKLALGSAATSEAIGRLHDTLQGNSSARLTSKLLLDFLQLLLL